MRLGISLSVIAVLSASFAAHADSYEIFDVSATAGYQDYTVTGTVTFDTTTSTFTDSDLSTSFGSVTGAPTYSGGYPSGNPTSLYYGFGDVLPGGEPYVYLGIPGSSLSGYSGGNLCSLTQACSDGPSDLNSTIGGIYRFNSGTLTPASATPEPSSFLLLGSGLLGVAGVMRRRLM